MKKRKSRVQVYDLKVETESKAYYTVLTDITKKKINVPILAKGAMRMIDFSKQIKKLDFYPPFEQNMTRQEKFILGPVLLAH